MIRVLLVDDHPVVQLGLGQALSELSDIDVIAVAENGVEAVKIAREETPNVVLLDLNMPEMNGLEAARLISQQTTGIRLVIFSMHDEESFIQQVFQAGAAGYVLKGAPVSEIAQAIRETHQGAQYLCPRLQREVIHGFLKKDEASTDEKNYDLLSDREQQILRLLVEGLSMTEIGKMLFISPKTVETHRANIMQKLGVGSLVELIKYCMRLNIIDPDEWKS